MTGAAIRERGTSGTGTENSAPATALDALDPSAAALSREVERLIAAARVTLPALAAAPAPHGTRIGDLRDGQFTRKSRDQIRSTGYVLHTLEAALWSVHGAADARQALLRAANLGEDADTVAAVAGQFAGAIWGESGLPRDWLDKLAWRDRITQLSMQLLAA